MDNFTSYSIKESLKEISESVKEISNNSLVNKNFMKLTSIDSIGERKNIYINPMYITAILPSDLNSVYSCIVMGGISMNIDMPVEKLYSKIINFKGE